MLLSRAFDVGERARGRTSPNPFVGCVIARDGAVVGEGWTQPVGGPHGEIVALRRAGAMARGATAYVTLEPCDHTGRTGPCSAALIEAGIARVVAALADPNAEAAGGAARLRAAGVEVVLDAAPARARRVHEVFLHGLAHPDRPFVVWKSATSLDGFIADHLGASQWITGPGARAGGHRLRAEVDAVLVGSGTALADDPSLTVRLPDWDGPQPLRVVLDRRGRIADVSTLSLLSDAAAPTVVLSDPDPAAVLRRLRHNHDVRSVLLEGGAALASAFMTAGLIDRAHVHLAGLWLGQGTAALTDVAFPLHQAPRWRLVSAEVCDDDVLVTAYPRRGAD